MIRRLKRSDYDQLVELIKEFYLDYDRNHVLRGFQSKFEEYVDPQKYIEHEAESYIDIKSSQQAIYVYEEDDKLMGYIYGYVNKNSKKPVSMVGFVEGWFVSKEYRGKQIGKALWERLMDFFKSKQCQAVELEVYSQNTESFELYKKLGFKTHVISLLKRM